MALKTGEQWKAHKDVTTELYTKLITTDRPETLEDLRTDPEWTALFWVWLDDEFSTENLEFLEAVDEFKRLHSGGDADAALVIFERFVKKESPREVNIPSDQRGFVTAKFALSAPEPPSQVDIFDVCYQEVFEMMSNDTWRRFYKTVDEVREAAPWSYGEDEDGQPVREVRKVVPKAPAITPDAADKWNGPALKVLKEGESTDYWEVGGAPFVILIEAKAKSGAPAYLVWAREYETAQGTITMTRKGSIFAKVNDDRGQVTVAGAIDEDGVDEAIGRFSEKEVVHA
jgi:hypothetical protein